MAQPKATGWEASAAAPHGDLRHKALATARERSGTHLDMPTHRLMSQHGRCSCSRAHHFPGTLRGLYLRYFFLHSICSWHLRHTPVLEIPSTCNTTVEWFKAAQEGIEPGQQSQAKSRAALPSAPSATTWAHGFRVLAVRIVVELVCVLVGRNPSRSALAARHCQRVQQKWA